MVSDARKARIHERTMRDPIWRDGTDEGGVIMAEMPHCDSRVLHAPGECEYCDDYPDWQKVRHMWGIAFTGHAPVGDEIQCPSETARPLETINRWPGNQPQSKD